MAKAQFPIDGKLGKDFKVTSYMGWRIHPVQKIKKHHNGTDIWSPHEPCWIEAPYDGKVIAVGNNPSGFGNSVTLLHKIDGKWYTTLYAHMKDGSIKVKKGQSVAAGTPLGKMGTTGMSTGKHLHWELHLGKVHTWNATGKGYIEPIAFFKALIAKEKAIASAPVEADPSPDAPVAPAPTHDEATANAVEAKRQEEKAAANAVPTPTKPTPSAPVAAPEKIANPGYPGHYLKAGSKGNEVKYIQQQVKVPVTGTFDAKTVAAVKALQKKHGLTVDAIVGPLTWKKLG
jgi:hypothetical protein